MRVIFVDAKQNLFAVQDKGENEIICHDVYIFSDSTMQKPMSSENGHAEMKVIPNPVNTTTSVSYEIEKLSAFKSGTMELYNLQGRLLQTREIKNNQGVETFDLSTYSAGSYILVFYHQDHHIGQQILIKK